MLGRAARHSRGKRTRVGETASESIEAQATVARMNGSSTLWRVAPCRFFRGTLPSSGLNIVYELTSREFSFIHNGWLW